MKRRQTTLDDRLFQMEYGLYCSAGDFYLDPLKPSKTAVITHAHADHATLGHHEIYCTAATAALMKARFGTKLNSQFHLKEANELFHINGVPVTFYNAGHILGSVQVLLELNGKRILYTGDIKIQPDLTCAPYQPVTCDVLVTECTFANPQHIHPPIQDEIAKLNAYPNTPILLGCYAIGKSQRISQLIATHLRNKIVLTHSDITPYHKVYMQQGIRLENWIPYSRRFFRQNPNCIYLVPPVTYKYYSNIMPVAKAMATGWNRLQTNSDFTLCISDHVDWNDLIMLIQQSGAQKVITLHGDGKLLAQHFDGSRKEFLVL